MIAADPMLAAPVSAGAVKEPAVVVTEGVESGSRSNLVTSSRGSGLLVIHPQFSQDTSMQSSSESGNPEVLVQMWLD